MLALAVHSGIWTRARPSLDRTAGHVSFFISLQGKESSVMRSSIFYSHGSSSNRKIGAAAAAVIAGMTVFPSAASADLYQIYEKFNYNPSWDGLNNTTSPQNFGYSLTSHTGGGDSKEAGGT